MLQLVALNIFDFRSTDLGFLMSATFAVRALFLTTLFPLIISSGRRWLTPKLYPPPASSASSSITLPAETRSSESSALVKHQDLAAYEPHPEEDGPEDHPWPAPVDVPHGSLFDLRFLKSSLLLDGLLTGCCFFFTKSWHVYLGASAAF